MKRLLTIILALQCALMVSAQQLRNPVIPGYHPDPSVVCVGNDFYLVNSSFQYFPGVPIYHSRDLVNWQLIGNVLDRESQLPLQGASSWLGIYAPTIRYHEGTFYMITTNVGNGGNFMVTATDPRGPWSEPLWLEQQGIDPSLWFENGKTYMVSNPDNTIMLCEIDSKTGKQLTESRPLWRGTGGRYPEGPHLYKKDGWYYLLISEGGTELAHKLTIARSRNIYGPYEANPANPILTNCCMAGQGMQIQGTGHGDFVQAPDGSWWIVFLAYRNFGGSYHHIGRETYLAPVEWKAGEWPVINGGQPIDTLMAVNTLAPQQPRNVHQHTLLNSKSNLGPEWVYLQNPIEQNYQFTGGKLRLHAQGWLVDNKRPTFLGRRQESAAVEIETEVTIEPNNAIYGLTVYQINDGYLRLYASDEGVCFDARIKSAETQPAFVRWADDVPQQVRLRITSDGERYHCFYARPHQDFEELGSMECSLLSTEVVGGFTGVTVGMFTDGPTNADFGEFSYFDYKEK
ncbi:MAG: glycoside hydrolase family 43 protein [Prevotella sp.]|nr:glycoside hydrolase family 43 protein [Prevotella sp.]